MTWASQCCATLIPHLRSAACKPFTPRCLTLEGLKEGKRLQSKQYDVLVFQLVTLSEHCTACFLFSSTAKAAEHPARSDTVAIAVLVIVPPQRGDYELDRLPGQMICHCFIFSVERSTVVIINCWIRLRASHGENGFPQPSHTTWPYSIADRFRVPLHGSAWYRRRSRERLWWIRNIKSWNWARCCEWLGLFGHCFLTQDSPRPRTLLYKVKAVSIDR